MLKVLHCQIDLKLVSFLVLSLCHVHPAEVWEWGGDEEINEKGGDGGEGGEVRWGERVWGCP